MIEITPTEIVTAAVAVVGAIATIIGGPWAAWTYFDSRASKAREDAREDARAAREEARAALAAEKEAWKELADFHKLTVDVLVAAVLVADHPHDRLIEEFQDCHGKWHALFGEKKGLLGPHGRQRANSLAKSLSVINIHHMRLKLPPPRTGAGMMTKKELISLCGHVSGDVTYFIH